MNRHLRSLQRGLDEILATTPAAKHVVAECQHALDALKPRQTPAKTLPGEGTKARRERRRREHAEETAAIREAVFKRAEGKCEAVWFKTGSCPNPPTELHHLFSGSGRRRQMQSIETCRAFCFDCHRAAHRASRTAKGDR